MIAPGKNEKTSRGLLSFGPGTLISLVAAAVIVGWQLLMPHKVRVERQVEPSAIAVIRQPSAEQLLNWDTQLLLTETQKEKLKRIFQEERVATGPVNADIDKQITNFNKFAAAYKSASLSDIEGYRNTLSELSQKKRIAQSVFEEQAMELLSKDQRATALNIYQALAGRYSSHH